MSRILGIAVLASLLVPLAAQQASFTPFGQACSAPGETMPAIGASAMPRLGTAFDVTYAGPNRNSGAAQQRVQPILLTGFRVQPQPVAVPTWLFPAQPAGCFVYISPDLAVPMLLARGGTTYESSVPLSVPNDPSLAGATWFHQWLAVYEQCGVAGCSVLWAIASDAAQAVAGS